MGSRDMDPTSGLDPGGAMAPHPGLVPGMGLGPGPAPGPGPRLGSPSAGSSLGLIPWFRDDPCWSPELWDQTAFVCFMCSAPGLRPGLGPIPGLVPGCGMGMPPDQGLPPVPLRVLDPDIVPDPVPDMENPVLDTAWASYPGFGMTLVGLPNYGIRQPLSATCATGHGLRTLPRSLHNMGLVPST
jgi:hypothetical protein